MQKIYNKKESNHRTYHINSPLRLCIFITLLLILVLSLISSFWVKGKAMEPLSLVTIEVNEGETLWSLAKQSLPKDRDIRDYIMEIKTVNNLNDANLEAGQELTLPVYDEYQPPANVEIADVAFQQ